VTRPDPAEQPALPPDAPAHDLAEAIVDLQIQRAGYEAALAATARVAQSSLHHFLR
jgi:hypothetical protein